MGQPEYLTHGQVQTLKAASELVKKTITPSATTANAITFEFEIPPEGIALVIVYMN